MHFDRFLASQAFLLFLLLLPLLLRRRRRRRRRPLVQATGLLDAASGHHKLSVTLDEREK